jgi:predicted AlkP superfamily pyrophosphatase or phosphodiesterase
MLLLAASASTALHAQPDAQKPTLVVFLTIDQMRPDYFTRWQNQLNGGLKRLYDGGAFFTNAYQDHAITETAPGHSATMSGRFPRSTGIIMNSAGVGDPMHPILGGHGEPASPFRFRGSTLTDWIRLATPRSRALSVSRKDRGAILPIGRQPEEVYWYDFDGRFSTSTYYHDTLPSWVQAFNARRVPASYAGKWWTLLRPERDYAEADTVVIENGGMDVLFPHPFPAQAKAAEQLLPNYPAMDSLTLEFALDGLQAMRLGTGPQTDILAVSLSSTDAVGHAFGPDSREIHDQILRLDRYLGRFLDSLFTLRDRNRIIIALTADHGVAPNPELHAQATHTSAMYVDLAAAVQPIAEALAQHELPRGALRITEGMVFVNRPALARVGIDADSLLRVLAQAIRSSPGVQRVDFVKDLASHDTTTDYVARRWLHMLPPDLPAELVTTLVPYAYWGPASHAATHGSPHDYDAHVPVLFFGPSIRSGRYDRFVRVVDIAPTLARIVGVTPTEPLDGRVLADALR